MTRFQVIAIVGLTHPSLISYTKLKTAAAFEECNKVSLLIDFAHRCIVVICPNPEKHDIWKKTRLSGSSCSSIGFALNGVDS